MKLFKLFKSKGIIKWLISALAVIFFSIGTIVAVTNTGYSATEVALSGVPNLTCSYDDSGSWTAPSGNSLTGTATGTSGTCGSATTSNMTITNNNGAKSTLAFSWAFTTGGGSVKIDGTSYSSATSNTFSKQLNDGASITIVLTGNKGQTSTLKMTNITLELVPIPVTTNFVQGLHCSYTINSTEISGGPISVGSSGYSNSQLSTIDYTMSVTVDSGYIFIGYFVNSEIIFTRTNPCIFKQAVDLATVYPVASTGGCFMVGSTYYYELNEAISVASSGSNKKVVVVDDSSISGTYTIPNGVTLLVPFDSSFTTYTTSPAVVYGSHVNPTAYKILTMESGSSITVQSGGAICCSGKLCSTGQMGGWNGTPTGPDGRINMKTSSTITIKSGGNLYAWGYIYGSGSVIAESGSTVYEAFQVKDWRGGTATSNCRDYTFIFSQYYVQNIEVPLTLYSGATEKLYSAVNASSSAYTMNATLIGSGGLFTLSSGYIVKDYIESTDRLQFDLYGNASISPMTISGLPLIGSISTSDYEMPITSNMTINIHSGTTSVSQNAKMLPSVVLSIDSGATFSISSGKNIYVYDIDDWKNYTGKAKLYVIGYSVANGTTTKRNAAGLVDAKIDVNGTIDCTGKLYTSPSGANITSSQKTGKIITTTAPGSTNATIYEMEDNSTQASVTFNPARLHNADNSYTNTSEGSAGDNFLYCATCNKWHDANKTRYVTFHINNGGNDLTYQMSCLSHNTITFPTAETCGFTYSGHAFESWNTSADGSGNSYNANTESPHVHEDTHYYAHWVEGILYTITWKNYDGSTITTTQVAEGIVPSYTGSTPTKPADTQYTYTFNGWTPTLVAATQDTSYTATYSSTLNEYEITWLNYDGSLLLRNNVPYGTVPTYTGATPTKPDDGTHSYTFNGWTPSVVAVTGNATYTATFTEEEKYIITWKNYDGSTLGTSTLSLGATPEYTGPTPTKPSDAQYTYTFNGWTPEIVPVAGDAIYTATFSSTLRSYTITWKNDDGTTLETDTNVAYGTTPTYDGATPTKTATAQYSYTFTGWTPAITAVTGDTVYTATYSQSTNKYTVIWKNWDGTTLETDTNVTYGTTPTYDGTTPTKSSDSTHYYVFAGWSPTISPVTGNTVYTATFNTNDKIIVSLQDPSNGATQTIYAEPNETIVLPTSLGTSPYSLKKWMNNAGMYNPGSSFTVTDSVTLIAYRGGWISDSSSGNFETMYVEYTSASFTPVTGIHSIEGSLYYFDNNGFFQRNQNGVTSTPDGTYILQSGIALSNIGMYKDNASGNYYYFDETGKALAGGTYYISENLNDLLPVGTYTFNADGSIATITTSANDGKPTVVTVDGVSYCVVDGIKVGYGLFKYNGNYYYAKPDGTIVTSGTYFVSVTNGLYTAGLYYFDQYGHMYSSAFVPLTY